MVGFSTYTMHHVIGPKLSRTGSKSILDSSDKWYGHHVYQVWTQYWTYGTLWKGPFELKILHLLIPDNYGELFRQHGSIYPSRSLRHLWNTCHVELLHFAGLEGILHDTRYIFHDFWHFTLWVNVFAIMFRAVVHNLENSSHIITNQPNKVSCHSTLKLHFFWLWITKDFCSFACKLYKWPNAFLHSNN